uniref:Uncharacterized protein n=1 Tax=Bracon brevicornis TaxID=1563983 RepID=A0A6V7LX39_9HYME
MSSSSYRVRKSRALKKQEKNRKIIIRTTIAEEGNSKVLEITEQKQCSTTDERDRNSSVDNQFIFHEDIVINYNASESVRESCGFEILNNESVDNYNEGCDESLVDINQPAEINLQEKLRLWVVNNIGTLRLNVVTELLCILKNEGHPTLPRTAETLLGTVHRRELAPMVSKRATDGTYAYLGIVRRLESIISAETFQEDEICLDIHIDGMSIYKDSDKQIWPITLKVVNGKYDAKPFVVALYCGDSKPHKLSDFFPGFCD